MKQHVISPETDKVAVTKELAQAALNLMSLLPMQLYNKQRQEHILRRLKVYMGVMKELVAASDKNMPLCVQYVGENFYAASYIEVQLVDKKNTIVYSAVVMDDN